MAERTLHALDGFVRTVQAVSTASDPRAADERRALLDRLRRAEPEANPRFWSGFLAVPR